MSVFSLGKFAVSPSQYNVRVITRVIFDSFLETQLSHSLHDIKNMKKQSKKKERNKQTNKKQSKTNKKNINKNKNQTKPSKTKQNKTKQNKNKGKENKTNKPRNLIEQMNTKRIILIRIYMATQYN